MENISNRNNIELLKEMKNTIENDIKQINPGKLMITKEGSRYTYYVVSYKRGKRVRKNINSEEETVYNLAHKKFLEEKHKRIETNIALLEGISEKYQSLQDMDIIQGLPKYFDQLNVAKIIHPDNQIAKFTPNPVCDGSVEPVHLMSNIAETYKFKYPDTVLTPEKWFVEPYCMNTSFIQYKNNVAFNGLKTRSKSESLILERYYANGIFFHYDESILLGEKLVSPDIIGVKPEGTFFIHEHAGIWTEDYLQRNAEKIAHYKKYGFEQGRNMILTFDRNNGSVNIKLIDEMIKDIAWG